LKLQNKFFSDLIVSRYGGEQEAKMLLITVVYFLKMRNNY